MSIALFWFSLGLLAYTHVGYPALIALVSRLTRWPLVAIPRTFCHVNLDAVRGALSFAATPAVTWKK